MLAVPECCLGIPKLDAVGMYLVIASGTGTMLSTVLIPSESIAGHGASGAGASTRVDATDARTGESIPNDGGAMPKDPWVSIMIKSVVVSLAKIFPILAWRWLARTPL